MKRGSASVRFVLATLALDALSFGIIIPVVPNLVEQLTGSTASAAALWMGSLLAVFSAMQVVCAPVLGALSDRYGRRPILLVSLAGISVNYLLLTWAPTLAWLFVGRLIAGATAANASAATAYIADVTPPARRAQRFGLVGAAFGLGFVLGPAFGGLLGAYGLRVPFMVAAGLAGCNLLYGIVALPESLPHDRRRAFEWRLANPIATLSIVGADRARRRLALAWCCGWFALGSLQSSFVLANQMRFGWGPQQNGLALAAAGLGSAVVQGLLIRRILPALGERRTALAGYALAGAAFLCFALAGAGWMIFMGIALQAFGAISGPAVQAMISVRAGPDRQGEAQGALASLQGLTAIVSPLVAGWLFGAFTRPGALLHFPGAPFLASSLAYGVAMLAVLGLPHPTRMTEETQPAGS